MDKGGRGKGRVWLGGRGGEGRGGEGMVKGGEGRVWIREGERRGGYG